MLVDILPVNILKIYVSNEDPREDWMMSYVTESWTEDQTVLSIGSA